MNEPILVSVIIPALNEDVDIAGAIDAVGAQSWGAGAIEVIVVDGGSGDRTVASVGEALARHAFRYTSIVSNPRARTSTSLNVGLTECHGSVVVRIDARSRVQPGYVERCVEVLRRPEVGVVGGEQIALARSKGAIDVGVARALRNRWTTGLARYRRGAPSAPADTVWMGAFRTDELLAMGGWDAATALNEDYELCERYRRSGAIVWFEAGLSSGYLPRRNLAALARQYYAFGRVKGMWWARGRRPSPRQVALLGVPPLAGIGLAIGARRFGAVRVGAAAALSVAAIESLGARGPRGSLPARAMSAVAICTYAGAWWTGTVAGAVGPRFGRRHPHQ